MFTLLTHTKHRTAGHDELVRCRPRCKHQLTINLTGASNLVESGHLRLCGSSPSCPHTDAHTCSEVVCSCNGALGAFFGNMCRCVHYSFPGPILPCPARVGLDRRPKLWAGLGEVHRLAEPPLEELASASVFGGSCRPCGDRTTAGESSQEKSYDSTGRSSSNSPWRKQETARTTSKCALLATFRGRGQKEGP